MLSFIISRLFLPLNFYSGLWSGFLSKWKMKETKCDPALANLRPFQTEEMVSLLLFSLVVLCVRRFYDYLLLRFRPTTTVFDIEKIDMTVYTTLTLISIIKWQCFSKG